MSVLVVGLSHRTAPVTLLERTALEQGSVVKLLHDAVRAPSVAEALVVATCNRLEIHADVARFHAGLDELSELLARHTGVPLETLTPHLYVHYEDRAVAHVFALVCGLESMVVGEAQILGQVRAALRLGQAEHTAGRVLNDLVQQALRVGKRAHAETGIDRAAPSLVAAALDVAAQHLDGLSGRRGLVVGAGSLGALATSLLDRAGAHVAVANRTEARATSLAASVGGEVADFADLASAIARADVLVTCTGAVGTVVDAATVAAARAGSPAPLVVLDLALPHDVDPHVVTIPGVTLVGLAELAELLADDPSAGDDTDDVRRIVAEEVAAYLSNQRAARVAPTVVALRSRAAEVVRSELDRLGARLPELTDAERDEVATALRRTVEKILHPPTVRMKEFAAEQDGDRYAQALERLFDLDPDAVQALTRADTSDDEGGAS